MKKKIGLTGSSGSLGKELIKNKRGIKFCYFKNDITNRKKVFNWVKKNKLNVIIHLAARVPIIEVNKNKEKSKKINYFGTKNLVDACIKEKINWFFFASTSHVYSSSKQKILESNKTSPISYYGKTKLYAEKYIIKKFEKYGINYCIGRIFSTTNINQKKNYLVPDLKSRIKKNKDNLIFKNLNHYRDFISMKDLSKLIFILLNKNFKGIINMASGKSVHLKLIAKILLKKFKIIIT